MPRTILTEDERAARKKARWDKIKEGRPNPSGRRGTPEVWGGAAEAAFASMFGGTVFQRPEGGRVGQMLARLGLTQRPGTLDELKSAFRKASFTAHPDYGGTSEAFRKVMEAYGEIKTFY